MKIVSLIVYSLRTQVSQSGLSEVKTILTQLEAVNRALLYPVVIIWVNSFKVNGFMCKTKHLQYAT